MDMDLLAVSSLIVAISTALGYIIHQLHLRNCECLCIKSDCVKKENEPATPPFEPPILNTLLAPVPTETQTESSPIMKRKVDRIF